MKPTILVVDSHDMVREFFEFILADAGYDVVGAGDGAGAEEWLERLKVDVVLLDPALPDDPGTTLLRRIRRDWPDVPVVIESAFAWIDLMLASAKAGACDYAVKPFELETLKRSIARALNGRPVTGWLGPAATEYALSALVCRGDCAVLLVRVADQGFAQDTADCLARAKARFAGQWAEDEFVLILDPEQVEDETARIREADLPVSIGIASGATVGATKTVDAILAAARENAVRGEYLG